LPIKTQSAKNKGRRLQQHLRDRIYYYFPWLTEGDVESRSMGASGTDLVLSPLARRTIPISFECKKTKKTPSLAELKQAREGAYGNTLAGVVWCPHGAGHQKSMIMFDLEDFLLWYKEMGEDRLESIREEEERRGAHATN